MSERIESPFEPRRPTLVATGMLSVWIAVLSLPMLAGRFLGVGPWSDQYNAGYAFRHWAAAQWKALGHVPLWNPEIFAGLPFVGGMHGDIFYPTAWLRLALPTGMAMNLGFAVHYVLAGLFMYLFLRALRASWTAAVTGGFAYQLSGVIGTYVAPGHDGKLFVTALFPLMMLGLLRAMRDGRTEGYPVLALAVGLGVLSPHPQMLYYALVASGIFALYLAFGREDRPGPKAATLQLGGALGAVLLGAGIGMIQILPFYEYIPFSPRAETYRGFEGATSYAIPWSHVPEFVFAQFAGHSQAGTYWGPNGIKLHSEYLGLPVVMLAAFGAAARERRRLVLWLGGTALLFLLIALGAGTPFYRLWYGIMPFMKQVRAPGMALYLVAFVLAVWAAFGVERIEKRARERLETWFIAVGALAALVALSGLLGAVAETAAQDVQLASGYPAVQFAQRASGPIRVGGLVSGVAATVLGGIVWAWGRGKVSAPVVSLALLLVVSADLFRNVRPFWQYSQATTGLYGPDAVTEVLRGAPRPYRVLNFDDQQLGVYPGSSLMAFGIPQLLGHHGNQIHRFNELLGGKNQWRYLMSPSLWELFAIRYVLLPAGVGRADGGIPGFSEVYSPLMTDVSTSAGVTADLFVRSDPLPYARLVPAAVKAPDGEAINAIVSGRLDLDRLVLLGEEGDVSPPPVSTLPAPLSNEVTVTAWEPGRMVLSVQPAASADSWLLVSENWYPAWRATVDGQVRETLRGNVSVITVPVPAGAREVVLTFDSDAYGVGKAVSLASVGLVAIGLVLPGFLRRRAGG